jgi:methionine-rich copper-binding protein CopC
MVLAARLAIKLIKESLAKTFPEKFTVLAEPAKFALELSNVIEPAFTLAKLASELFINMSLEFNTAAKSAVDLFIVNRLATISPANRTKESSAKIFPVRFAVPAKLALEAENIIELVFMLANSAREFVKPTKLDVRTSLKTILLFET